MNKSSFRFFFSLLSNIIVSFSSHPQIYMVKSIFSSLQIRYEWRWKRLQTTLIDHWIQCLKMFHVFNLWVVVTWTWSLAINLKSDFRLLVRAPICLSNEREEKKNCSRLRKSIWNSLNCRCKIVRLNRAKKKKKSLLKMVNLDKNARRQSSDVKEKQKLLAPHPN